MRSVASTSRSRPVRPSRCCGPNGAGKSTTIDMLLGLLPPDAGSVSLFGQPPAESIKLGAIGAMLQTGSADSRSERPRTRDHDGVAISATRCQSMRLSTSPVSATFSAVVPRNCRADRRSAFCFAVALVSDPDLLVLDEPTVAMDVEARHGFWTTMRAFASRGKTVRPLRRTISKEADAYADRIILMARGQIVADGPATQIKATVGARSIRATLPNADLDALAALPGVTKADHRGCSIVLDMWRFRPSPFGPCWTEIPAVRDIEISGR